MIPHSDEMSELNALHGALLSLGGSAQWIDSPDISLVEVLMRDPAAHAAVALLLRHLMETAKFREEKRWNRELSQREVALEPG